MKLDIWGTRQLYVNNLALRVFSVMQAFPIEIFASGIVEKRASNQNKNRVAYRNAGNCSYSKNLGAPRNQGP